MMNVSERMRDRIRSLRAEDGGTAVEYAIIASLVAAVIVATVALLGDEVLALFDTIASQF